MTDITDLEAVRREQAGAQIEAAVDAIGAATRLLTGDGPIETGWRRDLAGARAHLAGLTCVRGADLRGVAAALAYSAANHPNADPAEARALCDRILGPLGLHYFDEVIR